MSMLVMFAIGYAVGGLSALVLLGLTLAARHDQEMTRRDVGI